MVSLMLVSSTVERVIWFLTHRETEDGFGTNSLYGFDFRLLGFCDKGGPDHPSISQDR